MSVFSLLRGAERRVVPAGPTPIRFGYIVAVVLVAVLGASTTLASGTGLLLAGMYVPGYDEQAAQLEEVGSWARGRLSLAGTFIDVTDAANLEHRLEAAWSARTTPFVNVETTTSIESLARGDVDDAIARLATVTRTWLELGEGRSAILAPFQEMNLAETPWGCRPDAFREAYRRFVAAFEQAGVDDRVAWAFAPNGWTHAACGGSSEPYFPGGDVVDLVALSAYDFGPRSWDARHSFPREVYGPWLDDVRRYTEDMPILIAQTGTLAAGGDRARWLREMVTYLDAQPEVVGFIYFNLRTRSLDGALLDWRVFDHTEPPSPGVTEPAFADVLRSSSVGHRWPLDWFIAGGITRPTRIDRSQACAGDTAGRAPC